MAQHNENLDFSSLFRLEELLHLDVSSYSFYEVGLKKCLALASVKELKYLYINPQNERIERDYDWNFEEGPIYCMCFEPTGTWLVAVSENSVNMLPFLPLFISQDTFDRKWSLNNVTTIPLERTIVPTSVVWWLTKESDNVVIIATKDGSILFFSMDMKCTVGEVKICKEVTYLQICFDDSLDLLALIITDCNSQQWKLILEHRSLNYNWLQQSRTSQADKKEGFMHYIKQLSKDKITLFTQNSSKDGTKSQAVEYMIKPTEYLPAFRKTTSNNWALTAQYVNGHHFLTAFELKDGSIILESTEDERPTRVLKPNVRPDLLYQQGLWSQRLIYLLAKNKLEVHSAGFSIIQGDPSQSANKENTLLWSTDLLGIVKSAYLVSTREPTNTMAGWKEPTFMCDLQLPRFNLEPCLIITSKGAFMINTICSASEWIVGVIMRGGVGVERAAAALAAPVGALLKAASDMLLSRGKLPPAQYLYTLSQCPQDGWLARLGVFGRIEELSTFKLPSNSIHTLSSSSLTLKLLAQLLLCSVHGVDKVDVLRLIDAHALRSRLKYAIPAWFGLLSATDRKRIEAVQNVSLMVTNSPRFIRNETVSRDTNIDTVEEFVRSLSSADKLTILNVTELEELCCFSASLGLWDFVPLFSVQQGYPNLLIKAMKNRANICRGALNMLLDQMYLVPLLDEDAQVIFDFIVSNYMKLDGALLKKLTMWMCPLQDQYRPVLRDLRQGIETVYTRRILQMTNAFMHVASALDSKEQCPDIVTQFPHDADTWKAEFVYKRKISCGLAHWMISDNGYAKVLLADTPIKVDLIGRVINVACGRHHTLLLTENGVYAAGDNSYGQLGVGRCWAGSTGDEARAGGNLVHVLYKWDSPLVGIAAGHYHSAVIDAGGLLYTWGWGVHGQLGLASIDDEWSPQLVTKLQGRKVLSVGCGSCHTVALTKNGEVWCWGAGVFGQLGTGYRHKLGVPTRLALPEPITQIAIGYFHNLALTSKGELWCWGASPQSVRAQARRHSPPSPTTTQEPAPAYEPHLSPVLVDIRHISGFIVQIAAGWHHSCLLTNTGSVYTWGLNFDGQLGSGDRKQVSTPILAKMHDTSANIGGVPNDFKSLAHARTSAGSQEKELVMTKSLIACGGDFTIYIDDDGRIYLTGNTHQQAQTGAKPGNRIIMMKTSKRIIKMPASKTHNKYLFQYIDRIEHIIDYEQLDGQRELILTRANPLAELADFDRKCWVDEIIALLNPWIDDKSVSSNLNVCAKLAYHRQDYANCLKWLLDSLNKSPSLDVSFLQHTDLTTKDVSTLHSSLKKEDLKATVRNILARRIKEIGMSVLNEQPWPEVQCDLFKKLPCCCDEAEYLPDGLKVQSENVEKKTNNVKVADIIEKYIGLFPQSPELWETCFKTCKDYYIENKLPVVELELVLRKCMQANAKSVASAVMFSKDCTQYNEILTPKLYLNMCTELLNLWG